MENTAIAEAPAATEEVNTVISLSPSNSAKQVEQLPEQNQQRIDEDIGLQAPKPLEEEEELKRLLLPDVRDLPRSPPSIVESNFVRFYAPDFIKPGHDQYVYRHANGLCVIGLAPAHVALRSGVTSVDFNVGKSDRSEFKVTGKRKKNAQHFESNTALCKVFCGDDSYIVRCCVKGSLLEVNNRLIKNPELLNASADRDGYIAIIMPRPADWLKIKGSLVGLEEYKKLKGLG